MLFSYLAEMYEKIEATGGRLEMTDFLAEVFQHTKESEVEAVIYISQGQVAPPFEGIETGMGEKLVEEAIAVSSGYAREQVEARYRKLGDLGKVAEEMISKRRQTSLHAEEMDVLRVFAAFVRLAKMSGTGSQDVKIKTLAELLNSATSRDARYIVRFVLGKLRLGIGDPTILDALSVFKRGDKSLREELERAYNLSSDLAAVAKAVFKGEEELKRFKVRPFYPIRPALAERLPTAEEIAEKIGGEMYVDAKYDGFRVALHKSGDRVELFSRRQERTTEMFPEIVAAAKELKAKNIIFEGEAIAYNEASQTYLPFQVTIQRKRKHGVDRMAEEFPLKLFAFDVLYLDGEDLTNVPYSERRKMLEKAVKGNETIRMSETIITDSAKELDAFFNSCIERGLEGIIAKDPKAPYIAGARKFSWIKLKRSYKGELADTVDLVVVGYYAGRGMRTEFGFGGVLAAVYDEKNDVFRTITRIGSGFSEEQMKQLRDILAKTRLKHRHARVDSLVEPDFWVEPTYVITVSADEITRSPMHTCGRDKEGMGYALRFPRMVGELRGDKKPEDATSVKEIIEMYGMQKKVGMEEQGA